MAVTTMNKFPKTIWNRDQVETERQLRLDGGATSSEISETASHYVLKTVWP